MFKGPFRFRTKRSIELVPLPTIHSKDPAILRATIEFNGSLIELPVNSFSISLHDTHSDMLDLDHSYHYIENGKRMYGRWYDSVPMNTFRTLPGATYIHTIEYYEDDRVENGGGRAVFTIYFTENAAQSLGAEF